MLTLSSSGLKPPGCLNEYDRVHHSDRGASQIIPDQDCFVNQGDEARFRLSISKDAGVYVEYDGKSKESGQ